MKRLAAMLLAIVSLLSGCVVYDPAFRGGDRHHGNHDGASSRDHDRDGGSDRYERHSGRQDHH